MKQKALALCDVCTSPPVIFGTTKPEHFQSPLEDCHCFYRWVLRAFLCHLVEK